MSEQAHHKPEQTKHHEQLVDHELQKRHHEAAVEKARQALAEHEATNKAELAKEAAKHAQESRRHQPEHAPKTHHDTLGVQQSMKNRAYKRELAKIQTKLPRGSRSFSKFIHNPTVETVSNIGAQTIARPSGLLGGSIVAFVGSLVLYVMTKQYGFTYNYLMMFLLFLGGFAIGAIIELLGWQLFRKHRAGRH